MPVWFQFGNWPLRGKIVALLAVASLLPLGIATWISVRNAGTDLHQATEQLSKAHARMLARRIDDFNDGYMRAANLLARSASAALSQGTGDSPQAVRVRAQVQSQLRVWTQVDSGIRGVALLDASGKVVISSEPAQEGRSLARYGFVRHALGGERAISDVFLDESADGGMPVIGYLVPIRQDNGPVTGLAAVWVKTSHITELVREISDQTATGSFAVVVDNLGIRIAHSTIPATVFHPIQELAAQDVELLVAEQRFGKSTRDLVTDVKGVQWEPRLDFRTMPDVGMFWVTASDGRRAWSVGQRCKTVSWIVFNQVPADVFSGAIADMIRQKLLFTGVIMLLALAAGLLFSMVILRPVRRLDAGAHAFGTGNMDSRVSISGQDELGRLGQTFNNMAARIQAQASELLRESADQHRKLFQAMTEAFCTIELEFDGAGRPVDFVYLEANGEFERQSGLRDVVGLRKSEIVPELPDYWMQLYGGVALTGEPLDIEEEYSVTGRHYHVRAYRAGGTESRRVAILFNDITERRLAEQRKQAELESLSLLNRITRAIGERQDLPSIFQVVLGSIEEQMPVDFSCICLQEEHDGLRVECIGTGSRSTAQLLSLGEGQHMTVEDDSLARCMQGHLIYEADVRVVQLAFPQRLAAGGLTAMVAAPLQVENRVFGVLIAARRNGTFSSADCEFLRQLSEHVALAAQHAQLYAALQQSNKELRDTQLAAMQQDRLRALGQMASGIAHDINNAISPVALYTDSLLEREEKISETGRGQLEVIRRAIHDVAATVARMREFYRGREPQEAMPLQLNDLVPQVVELTRARWSTMPQQRGVTIEQRTELHPDLPTILGVEGEIREALTNLVLNAVDAMPGGGVLTLRTTVSAPGQVSVEVCDTGVGMSEDARRRCLEPFFTTKGERGTGLGLAMVYGMAQRHGAEIGVESAPGQGTKLRLTFAATTAVRRKDDAMPALAATGLHILVVDDDALLLRTLRDVLETEGHTVTARGGGQDGIDAFSAALAAGTPYSIVFTDLGMPSVDGRQVAHAVKARSPSTPVIMLTGWGERMIQDGDLPADVDLVLGKPPGLRALRAALARFFALARRQP